MKDPLQRWRATLAALELVDDDAPVGNMEMFSIAAAQDAGITAPALAAFVRDAHRAYSLAARSIGRTGWFYAWHDEMAGQLRTSACWIVSRDELPFGGLLTLVDDPESLASSLLGSTVAHGIPRSQLTEVEDDDALVAAEPPTTVVYARLLDTLEA